MVAPAVSASRSDSGNSTRHRRRSSPSIQRLRAAVVETLEKRAYLSSVAFAPALNISLAGSFPSAIATGDLGNGHQDIVVGTSLGEVIPVIGNGDGTFVGDMQAFGTGLPNTDFVAIAPLTANGNADLVVADTQGQISVLLGNGDGTFGAPTTISAGVGIDGITVADIDGNEDLLTSDVNGSVSLFVGNGSGHFAAAVTYHTAYTSGGGSIITGDFSNNGNVDVAVVNSQYSTVSILLGNSNGTFELSQSDYRVGNDPNAIAAADFSNDNDMDLVTADDDGTVTIIPGNGNGTFQSPQFINVGGNLDGITAADFNGDGTADLAVVNNSDQVSVLLGNGDFTFSAPVQFPVPSNATAIVADDFNGDGKPDLATIDVSSQDVSVLLNTSNSVTFNSPKTVTAANGPDAVTEAVLTNNRTADIVVAGYGGDQVSVLMGNGDGTFQPARNYSVPNGPTAVLVADVNGDGIPDLVVASANTGSISVLLGQNNSGTFGFSPAITTTLGFAISNSPDAIAAGDFTNDGMVDLAVAAADHGVLTLMGNGDGTFQAPTTLSLPDDSDFTAVAVGDYNDDGFADVVATDSSSNSVYALENEGDGTFYSALQYSTGADPVAVTLADLTGNGKLDIVTANESSGTVTTILGNGDGTFKSPQTFPDNDGSLPVDIGVADVNGDGIPDLLTSNASGGSGNTVNILQGNGDGTFKQVGSMTVGNDPTSLVVTDINGDARPDVITSNFGSNNVSIVLNNSSGNFSHFFSDPTAAAVGNAPFFVTSADLNGDGSPDLITADFSGNSVDVLLGNSNGTFKPAVAYSVTSPTTIVVTDLTGNGTLDLVVASAKTDQITVFLGNGNGTFKSGVTTNLSDTGAHITYSPDAIAVGDLANDGKEDLVIADDNDDVSILLGNGDGTFAAPEQLTISPDIRNVAAYAVAVADTTGDGDDDIVVADTNTDGANGRVEVLIGNGDGTFTQATGYDNSGVDPTSIVLADINQNGTLDVVTTNRSSNTVTVIFGIQNTIGMFGPVQNLPAGIDPFDVAVGDLTNDSLLDIIVSNPGAAGTTLSRVNVLSNEGNDTFAAPRAVNVGNYPRPIVVTDINGDQLPDIITANTVDKTLSVVINETPNVPSITENAGGTVTATGTTGGDLVTISTYNGITRVTIDGQTQSFTTAAVVVINTGAGNDSITIGPGAPPAQVDGGPGNDTIVDNSSSDITVLGAGGNDSIVANTSGADLLDGGHGDDTVVGGGPGSILKGNELFAESPDETLKGAKGNDTLMTGQNDDRLRGGPDTNFMFDATGVGDTLNGGFDNLSFAQYNPNSKTKNIFELIDPPAPQIPAAVPDTIPTAVPAASFGNPAVLAKVVGTTLKINGSLGNDSIQVSESGNKIFVTANGSTAQKFPISGLTTIRVNSQSGNDTVTIEPSVTLPATIRGGQGNDSFTGGGGDNVIIGGIGNDTLVGGAGTNVLIPGPKGGFQSTSPGNDSLVGGSGLNIADFSRRTDNLFLSNNGQPDSGDHAEGETTTIASNIQCILGGTGDDTIVGTIAGEFLSGGSGRASITGGGASDLLVGGSTAGNTVTVAAEPVTLDLKNDAPDTFGGVHDPSLDILNLDSTDVQLG